MCEKLGQRLVFSHTLKKELERKDSILVKCPRGEGLLSVLSVKFSVFSYLNGLSPMLFNYLQSIFATFSIVSLVSSSNF